MLSAAIYIVEDNRMDSEILREVFTTAGFTNVKMFSTAKAFLDILASEEIDVAAVDYRLPEPVGLALVDRILDKNRNSKVIMMSNITDAKVFIEMINKGLDGYIDKSEDHWPIKLVDLVRSLSEQIQKRQDFASFIKQTLAGYGANNQ